MKQNVYCFTLCLLFLIVASINSRQLFEVATSDLIAGNEETRPV
jgi:hypothetical protein